MLFGFFLIIDGSGRGSHGNTRLTIHTCVINVEKILLVHWMRKQARLLSVLRTMRMTSTRHLVDGHDASDLQVRLVGLHDRMQLTFHGLGRHSLKQEGVWGWWWCC